MELAAKSEGLIAELPTAGRLVKCFPLPHGGSIATHLDCTEQRTLSRELASTKHLLESVHDNVPAASRQGTAAISSPTPYIFANRAFERFAQFSRDHIIGRATILDVIDLGHGMGMSLLAEGVDTIEQLTFLADEGCDAMQGYLIGKRFPIGQYAALVGRSINVMEPARETG